MFDLNITKFPKINNALVIDVPKEEGTIQLTLEVALQLGDDVVRTIAMDSTDGVQRGMDVKIQAKELVYLLVTKHWVVYLMY